MTIWANSGPILGHSGSFWSFLVIPEPFWPFRVISVIFIIPDDFGPFWAILVILNHSGSFWSFLVVPGPFWSFLVISVFFVLFTIFGHFWSFCDSCQGWLAGWLAGWAGWAHCWAQRAFCPLLVLRCKPVRCLLRHLARPASGCFGVRVSGPTLGRVLI